MSIVKTVCRAMERIAPLRLAESWDNVGLLLESPFQRAQANRILLTIDLTPSVMREALATPTAFIVTYHPTIFRSISSVTMANPLQASLLRCASEGISVYSPHTSVDAVWGGVNDWLADGLKASQGGTTTILGAKKVTSEGIEEGGEGRFVTLTEPVSVDTLIARVKSHLGLRHVQVGYPDTPSRLIQSVGICAGSGGSMLLGTAPDVYFTGELAHHEVLAATAAGKHVILCGHTNTERGYLSTLAKKLLQQLSVQDGTDYVPGLGVDISKEDAHPLHIV